MLCMARFALCCWCFVHFGSLALGAENERNNWAVLVDTSRYFYNYRHVANVLTFYHTIKRLGIPDSQIILMMAEDIPCNSRSAQPGMVFRESVQDENLYGEDVEVDYRGDEVSTENFLRLLTGRHLPSTPRNKRLLTDEMSNVLIFITGHSGDEFIKFQDWEELTSNDVADAFQQMHKQRRYRNIFWISDTCQAATLQNQFYTPGILAYGSSGKGQNSYSHHVDSHIGAAVIDRWTYYAMDFFKRITTSSDLTVEHFTSHFKPAMLHSQPELRTDLFQWSPSQTMMTEFFASTGRMRFQSALLVMQASNSSSSSSSSSSSGAAGDGSCSFDAASSGSCVASPPSAPPTYAEEESPWGRVSHLASAVLDVASAKHRPGMAFSQLGGSKRLPHGVLGTDSLDEIVVGSHVPWLVGLLGAAVASASFL